MINKVSEESLEERAEEIGNSLYSLRGLEDPKNIKREGHALERVTVTSSLDFYM